MNIIPSILVKTAKAFKQQINQIQKHTDIIQLDIADGNFVDNKTWADPDVVKKLTTCDIELHLMVSNPLEELKRWHNTEQIIRILVHYESVKNLADIMPTLHAYGWEIGIVLNPETDINVLESYINEIKLVQFMTIHPGKQGQKFLPEVVKKIKIFHAKYPDMSLAADGHVDETTIPDLIKAGITHFGVGSTIFGDKNPVERLKKLEQLLTR